MNNTKGTASILSICMGSVGCLLSEDFVFEFDFGCAFSLVKSVIRLCGIGPGLFWSPGGTKFPLRERKDSFAESRSANTFFSRRSLCDN